MDENIERADPQEKSPEDRVGQVSTPEELVTVIRTLDEVRSSDGRILDQEELADGILSIAQTYRERFREIRKPAFEKAVSSITRSYGIRGKLLELLFWESFSARDRMLGKE